MNYVTFIIRNLENVPGKSGVCQGEVREKSGNFFCQSLWEPCRYMGEIIFSSLVGHVT